MYKISGELEISTSHSSLDERIRSNEFLKVLRKLWKLLEGKAKKDWRNVKENCLTF
jgi:hypothetical protein